MLPLSLPLFRAKPEYQPAPELPGESDPPRISTTMTLILFLMRTFSFSLNVTTNMVTLLIEDRRPSPEAG